MAVSVLGSSGAQHGVETAETGIKCTGFSVAYAPEINSPLTNETGEVVDRSVSTVPSRDVTIDGSVTGATGVMAYDFLTACVPANDVATFGGSGTLLMQSANESQSPDGWRSVSISLHADPGLTLA